MILLVMLLMCCMCSHTGVTAKDKRSYMSDQMCQGNVTAKAGMVARLFCCLAVQYRDTQISWVRRHDVVILSHGTVVFTSDARFSVHYSPDSGVWELRIRLVSLSDSGQYECQGNSSPKQEISVQLSVEDTVAVIAGPKHRYIPSGQGLELGCSVDLGPHGPDDHYRDTAVLHWLVNRRIIDPGPDNQRLQIKNNIGDVFQGKLVIGTTVVSDSGNYSCVPSYATPDWVMVHIITEDEPAGLQLHDGKTSQTTKVVLTRLLLAIMLLL